MCKATPIKGVRTQIIFAANFSLRLLEKNGIFLGKLELVKIASSILSLLVTTIVKLVDWGSFE